jgi:HEPN domain-containing protein
MDEYKKLCSQALTELRIARTFLEDGAQFDAIIHAALAIQMMVKAAAAKQSMFTPGFPGGPVK